eukprot:2857217-Prymnesium_polylepis.1
MLAVDAQLDLAMDADKDGFKQTVCTNGAIAAASSDVAYTPMGRLYPEEVPGVPSVVRTRAAPNGSLVAERLQLPSNPAQMALSTGADKSEVLHVTLAGTVNGAGPSPVQLLRVSNFSLDGAATLVLSDVTGACPDYQIRPMGLQLFAASNLLALAVSCAPRPE